MPLLLCSLALIKAPPSVSLGLHPWLHPHFSLRFTQIPHPEKPRSSSPPSDLSGPWFWSRFLPFSLFFFFSVKTWQVPALVNSYIHPPLNSTFFGVWVYLFSPLNPKCDPSLPSIQGAHSLVGKIDILTSGCDSKQYLWRVTVSLEAHHVLCMAHPPLY